MDERLKIQLNAENSNKLNQIYQFVNENSFLFDDNISSRNGFANQLLNDYLSLLIRTWKAYPTMLYSDFKKQRITGQTNNSKVSISQIQDLNKSEQQVNAKLRFTLNSELDDECKASVLIKRLIDRNRQLAKYLEDPDKFKEKSSDDFSDIKSINSESSNQMGGNFND